MVHYSNYSYEPSLGRKATAGRPDVTDFPVFDALAEKLDQMADDVDRSREARAPRARPDGHVFIESFFDAYRNLPEGSADLLVTSPPYLNNYHYNRNTRPHLYWLGFCKTPAGPEEAGIHELRHVLAERQGIGHGGTGRRRA